MSYSVQNPPNFKFVSQNNPSAFVPDDYSVHRWTFQGMAVQNDNLTLGWNAGVFNQQTGAIAIGHEAGEFSQGLQSIAIGWDAGNSMQGDLSIAIGTGAGFENQTFGDVAIGYAAGSLAQHEFATAIGFFSGTSGQGAYGTAIGAGAGGQGQQTQAVAVGFLAGASNQGLGSVAVGSFAGQTGQGESAVAVGGFAGNLLQGTGAVAVGVGAGSSNQGAYAVALGYGAGAFNQYPNSIAINGNGSSLQATGPGFFVQPVRDAVSSGLLLSVQPSSEITYQSNSRAQVIVDGVAAPAGSNFGAISTWQANFVAPNNVVLPKLITANMTMYNLVGGQTATYHLTKDGITVATRRFYFNGTTSHLVVPTISYVDVSSGTHLWGITVDNGGANPRVDNNDYCTITVVAI